MVTEEGGDRSSKREDRWTYQILHSCQTLGTINDPQVQGMLSVPTLCMRAPVHLTGLFFPVLTVSRDCGASDANECEVHSSALPGQCLTHPMTRTEARRLPFLKLSCAGLNPLHRHVTLPLPWLPRSLLLALGKSPHPHLFDCFLWKDSFPQGSLLLT